MGGDFSQNTFESHAALLGDRRLSHPMYTGKRAGIVFELQRSYGNQYVQRLIEHIKTTTSAPVVQRAGVGNPLAEAIGASSTQNARAQLGEQAFQVLNRLKIPTLDIFLSAGNPVVLLRSLAANLGALDAGEITTIIGNLSPGLSANVIANLGQAQAQFLSANSNNLQLAQYALGVANNDVQQAQPILDYLIPYVNDNGLLQEAQNTLTLVGNNVKDATDMMGYLKDYVPKGDQILGLAKSEFTKAGNDPAKAKAEMDILAKYNYDQELRDWSEQAAGDIAEEKTETAKQEAAEEKKKAYKAAQDMMPMGGRPKTNRQKAERKKTLDKAKQMKQDADLAEQVAIDKAEQQKDSEKAKALGEIETFIGTGTPDIGAENTKWLIQQVKGNATLAGILQNLFAKASESDAKQLASWAIQEAGSDAKKMTTVVGLLVLALDKGLDVAMIQNSVGVVLQLKADTPLAGRLLELVKTAPAQWADIETFVKTYSDKLGVALDILENATGNNIAVADLAGFIGKRDLNDVNWVLVQTKDISEAKKVFDLLHFENVKMPDIKKLLPNTDAGTLRNLFYKVDVLAPNPAKLKSLLDKTDANMLLGLLDHFDSDTLKKYLVDDSFDAATLNDLTSKASGSKIKALLTWTKDADKLNDLLNQVDADTMMTLRDDYIGYPAQNVVDAHLASGSWDKSTYPSEMASILDHYKRHVLDENLNKTVAEFNTDARDLWNDRNNNQVTNDTFNGNPRVKVRKTGTTIGGNYSPSGNSYTFWYQ